MTADQFRAGLTDYIKTTFLAGQPVGPSDDLLLSGAIDSIGVMTLVAEVERMTGGRIPPEDVTLENFVCIDAITAYAMGGAK